MAAWPTLPSDFTIDQVMWIPISWAVNPREGGRVMVKGSPVGPLSCLVQGKSAADFRGQHREAQIGKYDVIFNQEITFKIRDQLVWLNGDGRILTILGIYPIASGTGRVWHCTCEEHPIT